MRRQARRLKSTLKVEDDLDHILKVDLDQEDQQAGEDVGILSYQKAGDTRDNSMDPSAPRFLQDRDFCECVEYGYAVEEEQFFDTAVAPWRVVSWRVRTQILLQQVVVARM